MNNDSKFTLTEKDAKDSPVQDIKWEGQSAETGDVSLMDTGTGTAVILRTFEYALPPLEQLPSKKELIEHHLPRIEAFLWKDSLNLIQEPKLIFSKDKKNFRIFVTCEARAGAVITEKPKLIQDYVAH